MTKPAKRKYKRIEPILPRLKQARKELNLTQLQVAKHLGIGGNAYAKIERGVMPIPLRHVDALAKLLYFPRRDIIRMVFEFKGLI